ncbi:MAG: PKD domain-containing protein, partial [Planctomycetota bacterium]
GPSGTETHDYIISVSVSDGTDGDAAMATVTVNNVGPVLSGLSNSSPEGGGASEGHIVTVSASFSDPGVLDTHTATIEWGDGTSTSGTVTESGGLGTAEGGHVYESGGIYTIAVSVTDDDGGRDTETTTAVVSGVGLHNGVLQIIGTNENDHVFVQDVRRGDLLVFADFRGGRRVERYAGAAVSQIDIRMYGGNDQAHVGARVRTPAFIDGGAGNDILHGGSGADILLGGLGRDLLFGGRGRDLIIGGLGADLLMGSFSDDILIGGTTEYDEDSEALYDIQAIWTSEEDHATRVAILKDTTRPTYLTEGETVWNDDSVDFLFGGPARDWLFYDLDLDRVFGGSRR